MELIALTCSLMNRQVAHRAQSSANSITINYAAAAVLAVAATTCTKTNLRKEIKMKLMIKTDDERFLQLNSRTIPLKWCPAHETFEGKCEVAELKGENGAGLPLDAMLILTEEGKLRFQLCDGVYVTKQTQNSEPICLHYGFSWEGQQISAVRKKLHQYNVASPDTAFINRLLEHFDAVSPEQDYLLIERHISSLTDLYAPVTADLEYLKNLVEQM